MKCSTDGNSVNGRSSSRVTITRGVIRSRGQLVRRVKGFQDWKQVDVGPARTSEVFAVPDRSTDLVNSGHVSTDYKTASVTNDDWSILLEFSYTGRDRYSATGSRIPIDEIGFKELGSFDTRSCNFWDLQIGRDCEIMGNDGEVTSRCLF